MAIDNKKLEAIEAIIDGMLDAETTESLTEWLINKRRKDNECKMYVSGMDTSGRCNNCGKNKWEHNG